MREDCSKRWGRSMRTDEQQCLSMKTVLTVTPIQASESTIKPCAAFRPENHKLSTPENRLKFYKVHCTEAKAMCYIGPCPVLKRSDIITNFIKTNLVYQTQAYNCQVHSNNYYTTPCPEKTPPPKEDAVKCTVYNTIQ